MARAGNRNTVGVNARRTQTTVGRVSSQSVARPNDVISAINGGTILLQRLANTNTEQNRFNGLITNSNLFVRETRRIQRLENLQNISLSRIENTSFDASKVNGISSYKPEIISVCDFEPVFDNNNNYTEFGKQYYDFQLQEIEVKKELLKAIITKLFNNSTQEEKNEVGASFLRDLGNSGIKLNNIYRLLQTIEIIKSVFDIKRIDENQFNRNVFKSIRNFFIQNMGFSFNSFQNFANTKILLQLLYDLKKSLEQVSPFLLSHATINLNRERDNNPIAINSSFPAYNTLFGISANNITNSAVFEQIQNSLPISNIDKIKLLTVLLSREIRFSKSLSSVAREYNIDIQNGSDVFGRIIGITGNTILDLPRGIENSLISLFLIKGNNEELVLPFETKFFNLQQSNNENRLFVPGTSYFIDTIIKDINPNSENVFNTLPILNYIQRFNNTSSNSIQAIAKLMDFNGSKLPVIILGYLLNAVKNVLTNIQQEYSTNRAIASNIALFRRANIDNTLKNILFQYCIVKLISRNAGEVTAAIMNEIGQPNRLPILNNISNEINSWSNANVLLRQIGDSIQRHIENTIGLDSNSKSRAAFTNILQFEAAEVQDIKSAIAYGQIIFDLLINTANIVFENLEFPTAYRNSSATFMFYMLFEIYCNLYSILSISDFSLPEKSNVNIQIAINLNYNRSSIVAIQSILSSTEFYKAINPNDIGSFIQSTSTSNIDSFRETRLTSRAEISIPAGDRTAEELFSMLRNIGKKLYEDELYIANILHFFSVLLTNLNNTRNVITTVFNRNTFNSIGLNENLSVITGSGQIRLLTKIQNDIKDIVNNNEEFVLKTVNDIDKNKKELLSLLLKKDIFKQKVKLFTIGIPLFFSKNLADIVNIQNNQPFSSLLTDKEFDIIAINLYKRSIQFQDIVFKPQKYIFDLSLFVPEKLNMINNTKVKSNTFESMIRNVYLTDLKNPLAPEFILLESLLSDPRYENIGLSIQDKVQLFLNHITSDLLNIYIRIIANINVDEKVFNDINNRLFNRNIFDIDESIRKIIVKFINSNFGLNFSRDTSFEDIVKNNSIDKDVKESLILLLENSFLIAARQIIKNLFVPKLFERIFTIPVNISNFEIDYEKTIEKQEGKKLLEFLLTKDMIIKIDNKYFMKEISNTIFEDYFTTIELVK